MTQEEYGAKKAALIEEIERAFDGVARGNGPTLHEANAMDRWDGPHAERAARRRDSETRWQDIPQDVLYLVPLVATFLNPAGFRYYLPAYLIWYIHELDTPADGGDSEDSAGFDPLAFFYISLLGSGTPVMDFRTSSKLNLLSAEQSRAVAHFLEFEVLRAGFYFDLYQEKPEGEDAEYWPQVRAIEVDFLSSGAQSALKEYWGQFLK
ncbi:hypothetical protein IAD21_04967 [Abditibacteriota bacterium]|nr:hypothetical protein IAD21_04967 [Abditibacteriota bacterium]